MYKTFNKENQAFFKRSALLTLMFNLSASRANVIDYDFECKFIFAGVTGSSR
jgi:hypothetical protein